MMNFFLIYFLIMNIIAVYLMFEDKRRAKRHQYRIQEKTLWIVSILGGAIGATIGMEWFRHKTKHITFKWGLPSLAIVEIVVVGYFLFDGM